jgi:hypothetical protein
MDAIKLESVEHLGPLTGGCSAAGLWAWRHQLTERAAVTRAIWLGPVAAVARAGLAAAPAGAAGLALLALQYWQLTTAVWHLRQVLPLPEEPRLKGPPPPVV